MSTNLASYPEFRYKVLHMYAVENRMQNPCFGRVLCIRKDISHLLVTCTTGCLSLFTSKCAFQLAFSVQCTQLHTCMTSPATVLICSEFSVGLCYWKNFIITHIEYKKTMSVMTKEPNSIVPLYTCSIQ